MGSIDGNLIYWGLLGMMAGLHLTSFTERDRQNRKIRHLAEAQRCTLSALRDAQSLLLFPQAHPGKQNEFNQKVIELERLMKQ